MIKQKEIVWIDWVKFICMVLVYWDHTMLYGNNDAPFIIPFRYFFVNAFFFISGYLIFMKELSSAGISMDKRNFLKKALSKYGMVMNIVFKIAIPTILFAIPLFFFACIVKGEDITLELFFFDNFIKGGNWFTCALTVSELLIFTMLISRISNILFYLVISCILALIGVYLLKEQFLICGSEYAPWFYKSGLIACAFLTMGGLYQKYEEKIDKFGILYLSMFILIAINCNQDIIPMSTWAGIDLDGFVISIISILAVITFCKPLTKHKFVKYISRHTIGLYFLSAAVPFLCIRICDRFISEGAVSFMVQFILSFVLSWITVYLIDRYLPFIFDLRLLFRNKK